MADAPLHYMTITEVATLIKAREISPVEVTEAMLRRIEGMLPKGDRDRVFQALIDGSSDPGQDDRKKLLPALDGSREDWVKAVDGLLERCSPTS